MTSDPHRVVIVGGGFAGLHAAKALRRAPVELTLIDRRNFHLFQPLLYQVATGGLSPGDITSPIRRILRRSKNTTVLLDEVMDIDVANRHIVLHDRTVDYDTLILAAGASHHYFGNNEWERWAPGLKTIEDATHIRARVLFAFEAAERELDPAKRAAWLTFVVVGAGPTGVELAGAVGELANDTLKNDFRSINPRDATILLVEGRDRVLPTYPQRLSNAAKGSLERLGVTLALESSVANVLHEGVRIRSDNTETFIRTHCVLWAAGVQASPLSQLVAKATKTQTDRAGRVVVEADLTISGYPDIFVIGDMCHCEDQNGDLLPGVAPVAMQQGRHVAKTIRARLNGKTHHAFRYADRGNLATIGRRAAVADFGKLRFSGFPAWAMWLGIHLTFLIEFENKVLVLVQWAWNYLTRNRGARLIAPPVETFDAAPDAPLSKPE